MLRLSLLVGIAAIFFACHCLIQNPLINFTRDRALASLYQDSPGMGFLGLPHEIHRIVSHLLSNRDAAALFSSKRDLHAMCDLTEREKYRRVRITAGDQSIEDAFEFLMDILKRPCLGAFVERIDYIKTPKYGIDYTEKEYERNLSDEEMRLLRTAVRNAGFSGTREERVVNMLMQKTPNKDAGVSDYYSYEVNNYNILPAFVAQALVAVLVSVSPNIVSMGMTQPFSHYIDDEEEDGPRTEFPLVQLLRQANANPGGTSYLRSLRDVYLINTGELLTDDGRFYVKMDMIGCLELFNRLPSIESVSIDALEEDEDHGKPGFEQKTSNISRVRINHSSLDTTYLLRVLSSCKALRQFQYNIGGRASNDGGFPIFNAKAFIKGICGHKNTLETLDVDIEREIWEFHPDYPHAEPDFERHGGPAEYEDNEDLEQYQFMISIWEHSGSLKDFVALKELSLGIGLLLYFAKGVSGSDGAKREEVTLANSLPDSLEYLCIRGYQRGKSPDHDAQIDVLVEQFKSGSLKLKEIRGVDEMIPNAETIEDPDYNGELLWSLEDAGYGGDVYEYLGT